MGLLVHSLYAIMHFYNNVDAVNINHNEYAATCDAYTLDYC